MRKGLWTCQQDRKLLELLSHEQDQNQSSYTCFFSFALSNSIAQASDYRLDLKSLAITQRQVQIRFLDSTHMHIRTFFESTLLACRSQQELRAALQSMPSTLQDAALYPNLTPRSCLVLFLPVLLIMFLCNNNYPNPTDAYCHLSLKSYTAPIPKLL